MDGNCTTYEYGLWETITKNRGKIQIPRKCSRSKSHICMITNKFNDPKICYFHTDSTFFY